LRRQLRSLASPTLKPWHLRLEEPALTTRIVDMTARRPQDPHQGVIDRPFELSAVDTSSTL
jgi:hypothetical protein